MKEKGFFLWAKVQFDRMRFQSVVEGCAAGRNLHCLLVEEQTYPYDDVVN